MFETDIHHALQSLATPALTWFMIAVSFVGNVQFLVPFVVLIMFGFDTRKGFALLHLILWTAALTSILKEWIAYPRPDLADAGVLLLGKGTPNLSPFVGMDAPDFWSAVPHAVIDYHRAMGFSHGIPSAHASIAVATWGGLSLLFRRRWILLPALALILLTPISRMYLGKHFLADVVAGLLVGSFMLGLAVLLVRRIGALTRIIRSELLASLNARERTLAILYLLALPPLLGVAPEFTMSQASLLWGLNAGFLFSWSRRLITPSSDATARVLDVLIAGSALAAGFVGSELLRSLNQAVLSHAVIFLGGFMAFWVTSIIATRTAPQNRAQA